MKLKKTRKERTCSTCLRTIKRKELYGQKSKSIAIRGTCWTVDDRPKEEIPDWAWETSYIKKMITFCEACANEQI